MAQNVMYISDPELVGDLKQLYANIRQELFPISTPTFAAIKKVGPGSSFRVNWGGQNVYFDVQVSPPTNWGWNQTGLLPYSTQAPEVPGNVGITRFYVTRAFDNLAIVGTASKEAAFMSLREKIAREFKTAMSMGMQQAIHGAGDGKVAIVSSASNSSTLVATSPYGVSGAGQGGLWLYPGQYITVYDTTLVTNRGTAKISTVVNAGDSVTITLAASLTAPTGTDVIYNAVQGGDSKLAVMNGLINITNRGGSYATLHNISQGTYARWDATRFVAGTDTDLTVPGEMDLWKLLATIKAKSGHNGLEQPGEFLAVTTYGVGQQLIQSVLAQRNLMVQGVDKIALPGGYRVDAILGVPLVLDEYCPAGTVYAIHRPSIGWVDAADWSPVQYENSGAVRFISGQDAFETSFKAYLNVMTRQRNSHGSITGYTDTARFTPVY